VGIISADSAAQKIVVNPDNSEIDFLDIDMVVTSNKDKV